MGEEKSIRLFDVYKHTNKINGKSYIGITCQGVRARFNGHRSEARRGSDLPFHRAIRKYGYEAFTTDILAVGLDEESAKSLEILLISEFGTFGDGGYNACAGGQGTTGVKLTTERKQAISNFFRAMPRTAEHRARISRALVGKQKPWMAALNASRLKGTKQNLERKAQSLQFLDKARQAWVGSSHSSESKSAMRAAKSQVIEVFRPDGVVESMYTTLRALAEKNNISAAALSQAAKIGRTISKQGALYGCRLEIKNR